MFKRRLENQEPDEEKNTDKTFYRKYEGEFWRITPRIIRLPNDGSENDKLAYKRVLHYFTDYIGEDTKQRKLMIRFWLSPDISINRYYELLLTEKAYIILINRLNAYKLFIEKPENSKVDGEFYIIASESSNGAAVDTLLNSIIHAIEFCGIDKSTKWKEEF